jgi:hypothetical protein
MTSIFHLKLQVMEQIPNEEEEKLLDRKIKEALIKRVDIRTDISTTSLSCCRHLLLRTLLWSPFTNATIMQSILTDYLLLAPELEPTGIVTTLLVT